VNIKKIIYILLFTVLFPVISFSQYFDGGAVAGLSASQVDGDRYWGFNKLGLLGGAYIKRMFTYTIEGQMELRYIMKGAYEAENIDNALYYKLVLHYVDIPLTVHYIYRKNFLFELGVAPEFIVYNREEDEYGKTPEDAPPFHRLTMSAIGGIGYIFWDKITLDIRYNYSVVPIRKHPSGQTYLLNRGQYNNVLTFAVYYQISK
jgi:hypothetical protein